MEVTEDVMGRLVWYLRCQVDWSYRVPVELTSEQISDARLPRAYYDVFQTAMRLSNTVSLSMTQHRLVSLSLATDNSCIDAWSAEAYYSLTLLTYLRHLSPKMLVLRYCQNCWRRFADDRCSSVVTN